MAVIILEGTLYSWETYRLEKQLRDVFDNPKICGAVLWINGPGGMVAHVDLAAKMIAESSKPIATYVAGTMGSAHFWLGTAAGRTFICNALGAAIRKQSIMREMPYIIKVYVKKRRLQLFAKIALFVEVHGVKRNAL